MASSDHPIFASMKPGRALGFVMYGTLVFGVLVLAVNLCPSERLAWAKIAAGNRFTFITGYAAFIAALWGAKVAVHNMVRQHTVNTILQSRLSEIFIQRGENIANGMKRFEAERASGNPLKNHVSIDDARYVLNFYEYVAVGVKHGDLDVEVIKDMSRTTVITLCATFKEHIEQRQKANSRVFRNLTNLADKWKAELAEEKRQQEIEKKKKVFRTKKEFFEEQLYINQMNMQRLRSEINIKESELNEAARKVEEYRVLLDSKISESIEKRPIF